MDDLRGSAAGAGRGDYSMAKPEKEKTHLRYAAGAILQENP